MVEKLSEQTASAGEPDQARTPYVQSVVRALDLLDSLGSQPDGMRLTELAKLTSLSPSTAHRLLTTLQYRGFVQFDNADSRWYVGRQAFIAGSSFSGRRLLGNLALPQLRFLRDRSHETASLGFLDGDCVTVLAQVESREIMRAAARVGGTIPALHSGMGKALLACASDAMIDLVLEKAHRNLPRSERRHAGGRFHTEIGHVRRRGYAVDNEENAKGLRCVAAAIRNQAGEAQYAISVSGISSRVSMERVPELGTLVHESADKISMQMPDW